MPRTIAHRTPVVVFHPVHNQPVACFRGKEIADDDALATHPAFQWLFAESPEPQRRDSVSVSDVEAATANPGQKRGTRRA